MRARSSASKPASSTSSRSSAWPRRASATRFPRPGRPPQSREPGAAAGSRCAACRASAPRSRRPLRCRHRRRATARALHDLHQILDGVVLEPCGPAEAIAQRRGQQAGARGRPDQREARQVESDRARRRPFADQQVELEVLHRRIQDLFDRRRQAVDLVDEEHVARFEVREERREIAGPLDRRARWSRGTGRRVSIATMRASEVLPRPGGPWKST